MPFFLILIRQLVPTMQIGQMCLRRFSFACKHLVAPKSLRNDCRELISNSNHIFRPSRQEMTVIQNSTFFKRTFHKSMNSTERSLSFMCLSRPFNFTFSSFSSYSSSSPSSSSFLKNQPALLVKRPSRKKILKIHDEGQTLQVDNVVAYAVAEEIKLESLRSMLLKQGLYTIGELPKDVEKILHLRGKYSVDKKPKEIFVFEDGSVVFWCVPEIERGSFLKMLSKHSQAPYQRSLVLYEREEIDFVDSKLNTGLVGDIIHLKLGNQEGDKEEGLEQLLELYTISNALSQSVKLAIWEASLDRYVTSIVSVTEDLRHGRKIGMSRRQVLMKTGELFALRHLINLSSDLLDTPDFYWERTTLEPLYQSFCNYLHMARRTRVMNEKLSHCCELTELLSSELNDKHHTRLEVMIIILILLEVMFEIIHFVDKYASSGENETNESSREEPDQVKKDNSVMDSKARNTRS